MLCFVVCDTRSFVQEDGRRYIDDAADESDGEGETKKNVDDDDDDDADEASSDDDNLKQKKKRQRKAFIVDDDEMEEDEGAPKEKVLSKIPIS